jgi:hypothetical protein
MGRERVAAMKGRLEQMKTQRLAILKEIEDRKRTISEMDRDGEILARALADAEKPKDEPKQPDPPAKVK